jgi:hypothetical protein
VVDWIEIVWLPASAPGGIVIEPPCRLTVPPCELTGWLTVAPLPTIVGWLFGAGTCTEQLTTGTSAHAMNNVPAKHEVIKRMSSLPRSSSTLEPISPGD